MYYFLRVTGTCLLTFVVDTIPVRAAMMISFSDFKILQV
jgi:hypothetical protein